MIRKGDRIEFLEQHRDPGDETFVWIALCDEEKGRLDVTPIDHPMEIKPIYTVQAEWVRVVDPSARRP